MDSEQMKEWIKKYGMHGSVAWGEERACLFTTYNSFEAHVTDTVKASFKRENTELAVIPGGLISFSNRSMYL